MTIRGKTQQFYGALNSDEIDSVVQDKFLRKALIDASVKLEDMLLQKTAAITSRTVSKTVWGLEIEIEMSRPKEDKPIIFRYTYRINRVVFKHWLDEHAYLLDGSALVFASRGITFLIPGPGTDAYHKIMGDFVMRYAFDDLEENLVHRIDLIDTSVILVVHREVVSNHDWIVKYVNP